MGNDSQTGLQKFLSHPFFERAILALIMVNAVTLGLETSKELMSSIGPVLLTIDKLCLWVFTIEILLKLFAWKKNALKDAWNIFDIVIVAIAWLPAAGPLSVLRSLRILRALRLISSVPRLRKVVSGLLTSLPGLGAVTSILLLLFYVGSVIATKLFGPVFPEWFGSIASSAYSLFQIMTLESWSMGIVRPVMEQFPGAWMFFVPFILVTTFTTLNLLIAVLVNAMGEETEAAAEERAHESHEDSQAILQEIKELRAELRRELAELKS